MTVKRKLIKPRHRTRQTFSLLTYLLSPPQKYKTINTRGLKCQIYSLQVKVTQSSAWWRGKMIKEMTPCHQAPSVNEWVWKKMKTAAYFLISHLCWGKKSNWQISALFGAAVTPYQRSELVFQLLDSHIGSVPTDGDWQVVWYCVASASSLSQRLSSSHVTK